MRNLTDEDVAAIVDQLKTEIKRDFYSDLGKGLWGLVWKALIVGMIAVAASGGWKAIR